jgi:type II secretory pathway pseudopilin PulG
VPAGATACPACRRPLATAAASSNKGLKFFLIVAIGGGCALVAIAVLGIVAALIIPNFLDALMKAKQKRTVADLRSISVALEEYQAQADTYPVAGTTAELGPLLAAHGFHGKLEDGWKHPLRYTCVSPAEARCGSYELASPGRDGTFEHGPGEYESAPFAPTEYDSDIVVKDGTFERWPQLGPR